MNERTEDLGGHHAAETADVYEAMEEEHFNQMLKELRGLDDVQLNDVKREIERILKERG